MHLLKPNGQTRILFFTLLSLITWLVPTKPVTAEECYLDIHENAYFSRAVIENTAIPLFAYFVEPLSPSPIGGINVFGKNLCLYRLSINESATGLDLAIAGRKLNTLARTNLTGTRGLQHILLRAIYSSLKNEPSKTEICKKHADILSEECVLVSGTAELHNANGDIINNGDTVLSGSNFFISIYPETDSYVYIFNRDSKNRIFKIFPNEQVSPLKNRLKANTQYTFPSDTTNQLFSFDSITGYESFYFLFSSTPLEDIEDALARMGKNASGELLEERIRMRGITLTQTTKKQVFQLKGHSIAKLLQIAKGQGSFLKQLKLKHQ